MTEVIGVRFRGGCKEYYFDPHGIAVEAGQFVIVETAQGTEYAQCLTGNHEVDDGAVVRPLRALVRIATENDRRTMEYNRQREKDAFGICQRKIAERGLDMKLVRVECSFDGSKIVFFFTSEGRVDFRELVRDLAGVFRARIELRQIGVRDEAKMLGGLGICGRPFCCAQFLDDFVPVSIKMAKTQNLSLNPTKISGACGRLMCCLRYEYETYKEVNSRAPKHGAKIQVPGGVARVTEINVPLERVTLQLEDGKSIKVPLAEMEYNGEGKRPTGVSEEVFEKYASPDPLDVFGSTTFEVTTFNGNEKLANNESRKARKAEREKEDSHRKPRRRRRGSSDSQAQAKNDGSQSHSNQGQKKSSSQKKNEGQSRRSRRGSGKGQKSQQQNNREQRNDQRKQNNTDSNAKRPGRKSSGVRNAPRKQQGEHAAGNVNAGKHGEVAHRKPRRRRRKAQGEGTNNEQQ